jgi:hypothetical protein
MRSVAGRIVLAAFTSFFIFIWYAHRGQSIALAQQHRPVTATRLYTGADGLTHVEQIQITFPPVAGARAMAEQSEPVKASTAYIVRLAPGFFDGWHNADKRRYVIPISGRAEIEASGGQKISIEPGQIALAEDLTGKGHTFQVVGMEDWVAFFVDFAQ